MLRRYALLHDDGTLHEIHDSTLPYRSGLVCAPDEDVYEIDLLECGEDEAQLVGWVDRPEPDGSIEDVSMIFSHRRALDMCFPYGLEAALGSGSGRIVYLQAIEKRMIGRAEEV